MVHVNALANAATSTGGRRPDAASEEDREHAAGAMWKERQGYATIQATRPQTLAYALTDSPVGLLAWDLEWFVDYDPTTTPADTGRPGRDPQRRHDHLAHRHRRLVGPHLPGGRAGRLGERPAPSRGADGGGELPR